MDFDGCPKSFQREKLWKCWILLQSVQFYPAMQPGRPNRCVCTGERWYHLLCGSYNWKRKINGFKKWIDSDCFRKPVYLMHHFCSTLILSLLSSPPHGSSHSSLWTWYSLFSPHLGALRDKENLSNPSRWLLRLDIHISLHHWVVSVAGWAVLSMQLSPKQQPAIALFLSTDSIDCFWDGFLYSLWDKEPGPYSRPQSCCAIMISPFWRFFSNGC